MKFAKIIAIATVFAACSANSANWQTINVDGSTVLSINVDSIKQKWTGNRPTSAIVEYRAQNSAGWDGGYREVIFKQEFFCGTNTSRELGFKAYFGLNQTKEDVSIRRTKIDQIGNNGGFNLDVAPAACSPR